MHRRLASAIEHRDHESVGESAALIAEHLEAAGDLRSAYAWHMRAGAWSSNRDIRARFTFFPTFLEATREMDGTEAVVPSRPFTVPWLRDCPWASRARRSPHPDR